MFDLIKKVIHDSLTGIDGKTYDPVKVIGYPSSILAIGVYLGSALFALHKSGTLDYVAYGTGFGLLMTGLLAIAAGVAVKSHTEPKD